MYVVAIFKNCHDPWYPTTDPWCTGVGYDGSIFFKEDQYTALFSYVFEVGIATVKSTYFIKQIPVL